MKGESVSPDVFIKPKLKCSPFMSYRCEKCGCNSLPRPYQSISWYKCIRGGAEYITGWSIIGSCAFAQSSGNYPYPQNCFGVDAPPPIGYSVPGCIRNGKIMSFSKPLEKNAICFDFPTN
jgi:hypothetical protein